MSDELNTTEERALDVLLSEVHGASEPPDLTRQIVAHLREQPAPENHFVAPVVDASKRYGNRKKTGRMFWAPMLAAIAASILLLVWYGRPGNTSIELAPKIAEKPKSETPAPITVPSTPEDAVPAPTLAATEPVPEVADVETADDMPEHDFEPSIIGSVASEELRNESLATGSRTRENASDGLAIPSNQPAKPVIARQAIRLVSQRVDDELRQHWESVGVKPTKDAAAETVARRVESALGVQVSGEVVMNVERLRSQLARSSSAHSIAAYWLDSLTMKGFRRLSENDRDQLATVLADSITAGKGFDRVVAGLITGDNPASEAWYNAIGSHGEPALRNRIAAVSMNVDLRCTRCHDAAVESEGQQKDYWSFAAVLRSRVESFDEGRWRLRPRTTKPSKPNRIFYDLADGRRRLVEAAVSRDWMSPEWKESPSSIDVWADGLTGSRPLAEGIVNTMWKTIFRRPLVGSAVDTASSSSDDALRRLERELTDDLIASEFDVARTLALMIRSAAMRRSVPEILKPRKALLARRDQLENANKMVTAFAAAEPERSDLAMTRKVAHVLRASGSSIELAFDDAASVLSQADVMPNGRRPKNQRQPRQSSTELPEDFPSSSDASPIPWLDSIGNFDQKIEHLAYLSGRSRVPPPVTTAVDAMRQAKTEKTLMLERAWWLLSR